MSNIKFFNNDCINVSNFIDGTGIKVDLVITSPPYNTNTSSRPDGKATRENRYDVYCDKMSNEDYSKWIVSIFNKIDEILSENGVILYNISYGSDNPSGMWLSVNDIIKKTNFEVKNTLIWKKPNAIPCTASPNKVTRMTEFVLVIGRKNEEIKPNGEFSDLIFTKRNNDKTSNLNRATYPSELVVKLLEMYGKGKKFVFDPFMGTGTTALGVEMFDTNNKMCCIGAEISPNQVRYSMERIAEYRKSK